MSEHMQKPLPPAEQRPTLHLDLWSISTRQSGCMDKVFNSSSGLLQNFHLFFSFILFLLLLLLLWLSLLWAKLDDIVDGMNDSVACEDIIVGQPGSRSHIICIWNNLETNWLRDKITTKTTATVSDLWWQCSLDNNNKEQQQQGGWVDLRQHGLTWLDLMILQSQKQNQCC